jgi:chromosome segregation ATPase
MGANMLVEAKTNGHAQLIEQRLAAITEQRVAVLRDALADFVAAELAFRDDEIESLKRHIADLEQKIKQQAIIYERGHEISAQLKEKQARRDDEIASLKRHITDLEQDLKQQTAIYERARENDDEMASLKTQIADLEHKLKQQTENDERVHDISANLAEKQDEIAGLTRKISDLERLQQTANVDQQVNELAMRLEGKQAKQDDEMASLKKHIVDLEQKLSQQPAIDQRVHDIFARQARRDDEIASLKKHISELEQRLLRQSSVDQHVHEIATRLDEQAARRDEAKRGPRGLQGPKGDRGESGAPGRDGTNVTVNVKVMTWLLDPKRFTVQGVLKDGSRLPPIDMRPLFESYHDQIAGYLG